MNWQDYIVTRPDICHDKACGDNGTRIMNFGDTRQFGCRIVS